MKPTGSEVQEPHTSFERSLENSRTGKLEDICNGLDVVVLVEDDTRAEPHAQIISALTSRLSSARQVNFLVAAGSHDTQTPGNRRIVADIERLAELNDVSLSELCINDAMANDFELLGETSRGTPVEVNPVALEADLYVVAADMKNHYFAGYSNALKDFLPGICSYSSIEANHSMALDPRSTFGVHPLHPDAERRDNPLASDMLEAERMITKEKMVFTLGMVTSHDGVVWSSAGGIDEVTRAGISVVDRIASFKAEPRRHIVVSPGGYPQDDSLYNAQRALELTKNCILDSGSVLLLSECENGIAPNMKARQNFYDRLTEPIEDVLKSIEGEYQLYSHKAYKFARMLQRLESIELYTALDGEILRRAHLGKVDDPQRCIDRWIGDDPGTRITFFDDGNKIAVYEN